MSGSWKLKAGYHFDVGSRKLKPDSFLSRNYSFAETVAFFLLLFVAFAALPCSDCNAAGPNLLNNNGFDQSSTGWSQNAFIPANSVLSIDTTQQHSGTNSAKIVSSSANDAAWTQTVAVSVNRKYRISGWIMTASVDNTPPAAGANLCLDGTWTSTGSLFGTTGWTYVSLDFDSGSSTSIAVGARLGYWASSTTGTAWYDDISLNDVTTNTVSVIPSGTGSYGQTVSITSNTGGVNCTWNGTSSGGICTSGAINYGTAVT